MGMIQTGFWVDEEFVVRKDLAKVLSVGYKVVDRVAKRIGVDWTLKAVNGHSTNTCSPEDAEKIKRSLKDRPAIPCRDWTHECVADDSWEGDDKPLSQEELARKFGVNRWTLVARAKDVGVKWTGMKIGPHFAKVCTPQDVERIRLSIEEADNYEGVSKAALLEEYKGREALLAKLTNRLGIKGVRRKRNGSLSSEAWYTAAEEVVIRRELVVALHAPGFFYLWDTHLYTRSGWHVIKTGWTASKKAGRDCTHRAAYGGGEFLAVFRIPGRLHERKTQQHMDKRSDSHAYSSSGEMVAVRRLEAALYWANDYLSGVGGVIVGGGNRVAW